MKHAHQADTGIVDCQQHAPNYLTDEIWQRDGQLPFPLDDWELIDLPEGSCHTCIVANRPDPTRTPMETAP